MQLPNAWLSWSQWKHYTTIQVSPLGIVRELWNREEPVGADNSSRQHERWIAKRVAVIDGRPVIVIGRLPHRVDRMVWEAYRGPIAPWMDVVPLDGNPANVRLTNLDLQNKAGQLMRNFKSAIKRVARASIAAAAVATPMVPMALPTTMPPAVVSTAPAPSQADASLPTSVAGGNTGGQDSGQAPPPASDNGGDSNGDTNETNETNDTNTTEATTNTEATSGGSQGDSSEKTGNEGPSSLPPPFKPTPRSSIRPPSLPRESTATQTGPVLSTSGGQLVVPQTVTTGSPGQQINRNELPRILNPPPSTTTNGGAAGLGGGQNLLNQLLRDQLADEFDMPDVPEPSTAVGFGIGFLVAMRWTIERAGSHRVV